MIGQHFDNIFLYTQDVTNKYNADNRLNYGVSKDLVADILRDMGIKIYQNNFSTNDLYSALLGLTPSGSLYNLPYTTGSLPTLTGYEYINTYITASSTGSLTPTEDINAEIYKRIYANLPYLLKKKGTVEGLRALVTLYGIPDTILQVNEFGGQDKIIANDYDLWFNQYNYAFDTLGNNYVTSSFTLNCSLRGTTVFFLIFFSTPSFKTISCSSPVHWLNSDFTVSTIDCPISSAGFFMISTTLAFNKDSASFLPLLYSCTITFNNPLIHPGPFHCA
jgi:hypothetical protein